MRVAETVRVESPGSVYDAAVGVVVGVEYDRRLGITIRHARVEFPAAPEKGWPASSWFGAHELVSTPTSGSGERTGPLADGER